MCHMHIYTYTTSGDVISKDHEYHYIKFTGNHGFLGEDYFEGVGSFRVTTVAKSPIFPQPSSW